MHFSRIKPLLVAIATVFLVLVATSLLDIVLVFTNPRFYSTALFITTFGVGGIFAGVIAYMRGIDISAKKDEIARWSLVSCCILLGCLFFFLFAKLEGGEYEAAFKAYGITLAASSLLFIKGKID